MQRQILTCLFAGLLQVASIVCYISLSMAGIESKTVILAAVMVVGFVLLFRYASSRMSIGGIVNLCSLISVIGVIIFQLTGFLWFPGLVKELTPFSGDHLLQMLLQFVMQLVAYSIIALLTRFFMKQLT